MKTFVQNIACLFLYINLAGLVLLFPIEDSVAQGDALLRILVISEEDGNSLAGASVMLYELNGSENNGDPVFYCVTGRNGFCEIRNIPSNIEFEFRITFIGFITYSEIILLEPDERRIIRALLEPDVLEFGEVTVEKQRYITTGEVGVTRISSTDISRVPSPIAGGDLASYLQSVPGVITSGDRGGDLYIRGGTPAQNLVLVDNLPIIKPFHISNLFSAFPDHIIQNADLFAGGFEARYAGATSAVIDIGLRPGNMRNHRYSAAASPYLVSLHAEGPIETDRQSFLMMGRLSTIEQFSPILTGEDQPVQFMDFVGRYTFLGDNITCNITAILTSDSGEIVPDREVTHSWSNTVLGGRCLGFSETFIHPLSLSLGYTGYRNTEGTVQRTERLSSVNQLYMNVDLQQEVFRLPIDYGFGMNFRFYNIELDERFTSFRSLNRIMPVFHLYISTEWRSGNRITIHPGIASQSTLDTPVTIEPRLRVSWQPDGTDRQQLSIAAGKYVQTFFGISDERDAGTVFTVMQPIQKDDPLPSSLHGIAAWQQRLGRSIIANLEGFLKTDKNIPVSKWTPEARTEIETALAKGNTYGFDVQLRLERPRFYASVGYGWSKVEYEAITGDLGAWIQEPIFRYSPAHDQRHKLNTSAGTRFAGFSLNARWEYGTGMPYTQIFGFDFSVRVPDEKPINTPGTARLLFSEPYNERLPYYHRLDISLERSFELFPGRELETQIGVINAYNRDNIFNFDLSTLQRVDQAPLLPYLSLKMNL
ncbi:MAG: TonB-dependent receptor plug domain-containing protein [Balneolaceae bacterium]